jgi:hypothetical protein
MEGKYNYARDAFMYLLSYATLLIFTIGLNFLTKGLINQVIPDPAQVDEFFHSSALTGFLAAVLIAFPIFWYINLVANKMLTKGTMRANTGVRHWLIYITLVVVILVIVWQLVAILMAWLNGALGLRFVLHVLVTLAIAVSILVYQWWHLKIFEEQKFWPWFKFKIFEWKVVVLVLAVVVWAFISIGSPSQQRAMRFDEQRVENLRNIQWAVEAFYGNQYDPGFNRLPESFDEFSINKRYFVEENILKDPRTGEPYEYRKTSSTGYELCATFETVDAMDDQTQIYRPVEEFGKLLPFEHNAERTCFDLSVALNTK